MTCPPCRESCIRIDFLPEDASDEFLRGMIAMLCSEFESVLVQDEAQEGMTGFVALPSTSEASRLIGFLDGTSNGAMTGKLLKADWATCSRPASFTTPCEPGIPDAKKRRIQAMPSHGGVEVPIPSQAPVSFSDRVYDPEENEDNGSGAVEDDDDGTSPLSLPPPIPLLSRDTVQIDNLPLDTTDEYLRAMISFVSPDLTSHYVVQEDRETTTGYVSLSTPQGADRLIELLNGRAEGAKDGMRLKVEYPWPRDPLLPTTAEEIPSLASHPSLPTLAETLAKFPLPPILFRLEVKLDALQQIINRTRDPSLLGLSSQTPEASRKDFLIGKILGPDGSNLSRLSTRGAQVCVTGSLLPELHVLITSHSRHQLWVAFRQVKVLLQAVTDSLLGQALLTHGTNMLLQFQT